jgi:acyl-coenzyme A thioesterase PaaI-like protein
MSAETPDPPRGNRLRPLFMRLLFNLYPPYLGTGIVVRHIAPDFRRIVVDMKLRFYNRNYVGTHFGGSLSAMTDPFYMLMVMKNLGRDYIVWDRYGTIEYRKPGRGRVRAEFRIDEALLEQARAATADGSRFHPELAVDIVDESDEVVAHVTRTLYIRRKRARTGSSASGNAARGKG